MFIIFRTVKKLCCSFNTAEPFNSRGQQHLPVLLRYVDFIVPRLPRLRHHLPRIRQQQQWQRHSVLVSLPWFAVILIYPIQCSTCDMDRTVWLGLSPDSFEHGQNSSSLCIFDQQLLRPSRNAILRSSCVHIPLWLHSIVLNCCLYYVTWHDAHQWVQNMCMHWWHHQPVILGAMMVTTPASLV